MLFESGVEQVLGGLVVAALLTILLVLGIKEWLVEREPRNLAAGTNGAPAMRRCAKCGREGTRGFRVLPPSTVDINGQPYAFSGFTVCEAQERCLRRQSNRHAT
jgi:hypothetical protein